MTRDDVALFIRRVNRLIEKQQLPIPRIFKLSEIGSLFFLHLFHSLFKYYPQNSVKFPQCYEDEVKNMQLIIHEISANVLSMSLDHIKVEDIINHDLLMLTCLLEILEEFSSLKYGNSLLCGNVADSSSSDVLPSTTSSSIKSGVNTSEIESSPTSSNNLSVEQLSVPYNSESPTDSLERSTSDGAVLVSVSINRFSSVSKSSDSQSLTSNALSDKMNISSTDTSVNENITENLSRSNYSSLQLSQLNEDNGDNLSSLITWKDILKKSSVHKDTDQRIKESTDVQQVDNDFVYEHNAKATNCIQDIIDRKIVNPLIKTKMITQDFSFDYQRKYRDDNWNELISTPSSFLTENETNGSSPDSLQVKQVHFSPTEEFHWKDYPCNLSSTDSPKKLVPIKRRLAKVKPRKSSFIKLKRSPVKRKITKPVSQKKTLPNHTFKLSVPSQENSLLYSDSDESEDSEESISENVAFRTHHNLKSPKRKSIPPLAVKHYPYSTWKERVVDAACIYGFHPPNRKLPHKKEKQDKRNKGTYTNGKCETLLAYLQNELPDLIVDPSALEKLQQQYHQQIKSLFSLYGDDLDHNDDSFDKEILSKFKHNFVLNENFKKDVDAIVRKKNRELEQYRRRQIKNFFRDNRIHYAQMKRYYEDYHMRQRSRMLQDKTKNELLLKHLFDEGMQSLKEHFRKLHNALKQQKLMIAAANFKKLNNIEKTYSESLSSCLEEIKSNYGHSEEYIKSFSRDVDQAQRDFRNYLKLEIISLQSQLIHQLKDGTHFRELDAQRIKDNFCNIHTDYL